MGYGSLDTATLSLRGTRQGWQQDAEKIAWTERESVEMQSEIVLFPEPPPDGEPRLPKHNLPIPLTPLVGREREVKALCALLQQPEVRLVTLAGTGGVGKTRLVLEVGTEVRSVFADGVYFVSLAPVRDPSLVTSTITQALALKEAPNHSLLELLKAFLHHKSVLLLLDNFEQILEAAPLLSDLLTACPSLKILVTSRSVLHVRGEYEFLVPPLELPDLTVLPTSEALVQYAAVALFLQRVHAIFPAFQMTTDNARFIAEICVHLDGLPLALELAAVRIKLLSPQALLVRLNRRLSILMRGSRDAPERQQTLRETIAWSYHLLTSQEQHLFQQLSVFVGSSTLEAIEALCAPAEKSDAPFVDIVTSLLDQSLLQVQRQEGAAPRFLMLETIREYALECLESSGKAETMRQRHATYYLALAQEAEPRLLSAEQAIWMQRLEHEHDNIRAALQWFLAVQKREEALRMSAALCLFWSLSHLEEGQRRYEQVLASSADDITKERIDTLNMAATLIHFRCNYALATELLERSLKLAHVLNYQRGRAIALHLKGQIALEMGEYAAVHAPIAEAIGLLRELREGFWLALGLYTQAQEFYFRGDHAQARARGEEALALMREVGEPYTRVLCLNALGSCAYAQGDLVMAYQRYEETLQTAKALEREPLIASSLVGLGAIAAAQGQAIQAARLWGAADSTMLTPDLGIYNWYADTVRTQVGYDQLVARARTQLGKAAFTEAWNQGRAMTLEQLLDGQATVSYSLQPATEPSPPPPVQPATSSPVTLTQREREVLHLLAKGLTSAQIAKRLVIGLVTVNSHVRSIYSKLGVSSRSAATRYAMEHHLL
jgi:predicted ATPase/DNA-binding CsgD family transcriptional regulator